jgi:NADPH-dependent 2,4-dienoyl-CoA reductase/sulfur reductase-like enzyme
MAFRHSEPWLRATLRTSASHSPVRSSIRVLGGRARARQSLHTSPVATRLETRPALAARGYASIASSPAVVQHGIDDVQDSLRAITSEDSYDIVIIGAGNAGLALACALREGGFVRSCM